MRGDIAERQARRHRSSKGDCADSGPAFAVRMADSGVPVAELAAT